MSSKSQRIMKLSCWAVLLVLLPPACKTITDDGITADVKKAIAPVVKEGSLKIDVTTTSGVVKLRGEIQNERQRIRIMDSVKLVDGVKSIYDGLTLVPVSVETPPGKLP